MKQVLLVSLIGLMGCAALADDAVGPEISSGVRVSLSKSFLNSKYSAGGSTSSDNYVPELLGFGVEYVRIQPRAIGFAAGLHVDAIKHNVEIISVDGNMTYGLEQTGYGFVGVNVTTLRTPSSASITPGLGVQFGVGANFTPNWGVDLGYVIDTLKASGRGETVDFQVSGIRLKAHYTF